VRPTILISVPRIYERFYAKIMEHRAAASWPERAALDLALKIGGRRFDARQGRGHGPAFLDDLVWPVLKRAVADKVLAQLGGRLRVAVSGGAPIAAPIIRLFLSPGLDVLQGYGMTETSPVVAVNTPGDNDPRTVGRPLDGIEVRIGDNEELLVRGPSVMVGYWRRPEETGKAIEADGWLHTGDQARIEGGRITITGRIKDIIVTSTGEKVAPVDLETAIMSDPLFEQAMVIGEGRPYVAALVVPNGEEWQRAQARHGEPAGSPPSKERQQAFLLQRIAEILRGFPAYATPRAVWWTTEPWTITAGVLTPTLKIKRPAMEQRFANEIAALYGHTRLTGLRGQHLARTASQPENASRLLIERRATASTAASQAPVGSGARYQHVAGCLSQHVPREIADHPRREPASGMRAHGKQIGPAGLVAQDYVRVVLDHVDAEDSAWRGQVCQGFLGHALDQRSDLLVLLADGVRCRIPLGERGEGRTPRVHDADFRVGRNRERGLQCVSGTFGQVERCQDTLVGSQRDSLDHENRDRARTYHPVCRGAHEQVREPVFARLSQHDQPGALRLRLAGDRAEGVADRNLVRAMGPHLSRQVGDTVVKERLGIATATRLEPTHQSGLDDVQQHHGRSRLSLQLQRPLNGPIRSVGQIGGDQDVRDAGHAILLVE
jgi:hypothetical protein